MGLKERDDLQRLLRDHPDELESIIGETLLVFYEEFNAWQNSNRRIDLLALDKGANLVIIELKRTEDGGHMELQALRYAAMISSMDFEQVVVAYQYFLQQRDKSTEEVEKAEQELRWFLEKGPLDEVHISNVPRVMLFSAGFSAEIITTVQWLLERGLDLSCFTVVPHVVGDKVLLNINKLLPVPALEEVVIGSVSGSNEGATGTGGKRIRPNAVPYLVKAKVLLPEMRLKLVEELRPNFMPPENERYATFTANGKFRWDGDGQEYAISPLCRTICERHGVSTGSGAFQGTKKWAIEGREKTLDVLRDELMAQANNL
ncbi:MAG: hypothetical protein M3347_06565 [Armatimonadota bacterium]|nr:hypothetical protein [Armatimonadota bacterium]